MLLLVDFVLNFITPISALGIGIVIVALITFLDDVPSYLVPFLKASSSFPSLYYIPRALEVEEWNAFNSGDPNELVFSPLLEIPKLERPPYITTLFLLFKGLTLCESP